MSKYIDMNKINDPCECGAEFIGPGHVCKPADAKKARKCPTVSETSASWRQTCESLEDETEAMQKVIYRQAEQLKEQEEARARFREADPYHVNCMWCGYEMERHDKVEMLAAIANHLLDCKQHPLARRIVELAEQLKAKDEAIRKHLETDDVIWLEQALKGDD